MNTNLEVLLKITRWMYSQGGDFDIQAMVEDIHNDPNQITIKMIGHLDQLIDDKDQAIIPIRYGMLLSYALMMADRKDLMKDILKMWGEHK